MSNVLIVEDDQGIAAVLREIVSLQTKDVEVVGTGSDALSYLSEHRPDVLLLDWMLPSEPSGSSLLREIQRASPRTAIIVCSAAPTASAALAQGASAFLQKPFSTDDLFTMLRRYL